MYDCKKLQKLRTNVWGIRVHSHVLFRGDGRRGHDDGDDDDRLPYLPGQQQVA